MMQTLFNDTKIYKGAEFTPCRKYRYVLWRIWDIRKPQVLFIGLNPSTANENSDDPTIRRVISFAKNWGYGGVNMMNLFAIVSKKPSVLKTDPDPIGDNDRWLYMIARNCTDIVFAWGAFKQAKERAEQVIKMFPDAKCLRKNNDGSPMHPLFVPGNTIPIKFNNQ